MFDKSLIYFEFMNAQILTVNKVKNKNIIYPKSIIYLFNFLYILFESEY